MIDFFKRKKPEPSSDNTTNSSVGLLVRLKDKLTKTRTTFNEGLAHIFLGKKEIDADTLEALESLLISSDLGLQATEEIMEDLKNKISRSQLNNFSALSEALKQHLTEILLEQQAPDFSSETSPLVVLMVGINGAGKTSAIGKLAKIFKNQDKKVILAAGDTFRAAAVEQLKVWGERNDVPVIAQGTGADSASVIFDALQSAKSKNLDVLIADTAGRLHTQTNLMEELKKIVRVMRKLDTHAPHEIILVLDASIGQNGLNQAKKFHEAVGVTSIILTKLDGTAKGGIVFNVVKTLKLPIRYVSVGEGIDDLRPFNAKEFVDALFNQD